MDFTVLFSTRNRARTVAQTLDSFTGLDVKGLEWEVLVADNGSTDDTPDVFRAFVGRLPLRWIQEPIKGKNRALNVAMPLARGQTFVFTDDDVVPRPDWLQEMAAALRRWPNDSIFGGRIRPQFPPGTPPWFEEIRYVAALYARFTPSLPEGPMPRTPFGPNFALRRPLIEGVRYSEDYDPQSTRSLGDETELLMRLMKAGHRAIYVPNAEVAHVVRPEQLEPGWIYERAYRFGRGRVRVSHEHANPLESRAAARWFLLKSAALYCAWLPFDRRKALENGASFHFFRGGLQARRALARQAS